MDLVKKQGVQVFYLFWMKGYTYIEGKQILEYKTKVNK
jgi:hypothetical protein